MKRNVKLIENVLLTLLLLGGMIAVYLYAGRQKSSVLSQQNKSADLQITAVEQPQQISATIEVSADGRLRERVLDAFSDAGYVLTEHKDQAEILVLQSSTGDSVAELILSGQGDRVSGLTLRVSMPKKPVEKKKPTLTEQALSKRYEKDMKYLADHLPILLRTALKAMDPYGEIPTTASLYWESLLLDALHGDHTASDAGEAIRFRVYETTVSEESMLCFMLQLKQS